MIRGIERRVYIGKKGIIPSYYDSPKYSPETFNNVCFFIFAFIGMVFYSLSIGVFSDTPILQSTNDISKPFLIYIIINIVSMRCLYVRERNISEYYTLFENLNKEEEELSKEFLKKVSPKKINHQYITDKRVNTLRKSVLVYFLLSTLLLYYKTYNLLPKPVLSLSIIILALLIAIYLIQYFIYTKYLKVKGFELTFKRHPENTSKPAVNNPTKEDKSSKAEKKIALKKAEEKAMKRFNLINAGIIIFYFVLVSVVFSGLNKSNETNSSNLISLFKQNKENINSLMHYNKKYTRFRDSVIRNIKLFDYALIAKSDTARIIHLEYYAKKVELYGNQLNGLKDSIDLILEKIIKKENNE